MDKEEQGEAFVIPLGMSADGMPMVVCITATQPFTRTMLRRVARYLDFTAGEWDRARELEEIEEEETVAPQAQDEPPHSVLGSRGGISQHTHALDTARFHTTCCGMISERLRLIDTRRGGVLVRQWPMCLDCLRIVKEQQHGE